MLHHKIRRSAIWQTRDSTNDGAIELVSVDWEEFVHVCLSGMCCGCPFADLTLSHVVEQAARTAHLL